MRFGHVLHVPNQFLQGHSPLALGPVLAEPVAEILKRMLGDSISMASTGPQTGKALPPKLRQRRNAAASAARCPLGQPAVRRAGYPALT